MLPREAVQSPSLATLKTQLDMSLSNLLLLTLLWAGGVYHLSLSTIQVKGTKCSSTSGQTL